MARRLALVAALAAGAAMADTPLHPPYDYTRTFGAVRVTADGTALTMTITAADGTVWTVPTWSDFFYLSPDGDAILVTQGAQLAVSADPAPVVGTVYGAGPPPVMMRLRLGQIHPAPRDLPRSASHVIWHEGISARPEGWSIARPGGNSALLANP